MDSDSDSLWRIRPGDLPAREVLRREPRLRELEDNPVYRLLVWRRRVAPYGRWLPSTLYAWAWMALVAGTVVSAWYWGSLIAIISFLACGFVLAMVIPRYVKLPISRDGRGASLLSIPDVYLQGLVEAGYPLRGYVTAIWADRLVHPGMGAAAITGCLPLACLFGAAMSFFLADTIHLALLLLCFAAGARYGRRNHRIELALKSAAEQCRRQRPDMRGSLVFAPLGWMNNLAIGCFFPIILIPSMVLAPPNVADYLRPPYWIPFIAMAVLGWFWGSGTAEAASDELERNYDALLEVVRGVEKRFKEAGEKSDR